MTKITKNIYSHNNQQRKSKSNKPCTVHTFLPPPVVKTVQVILNSTPLMSVTPYIQTPIFYAILKCFSPSTKPPPPLPLPQIPSQDYGHKVSRSILQNCLKLIQWSFHNKDIGCKSRECAWLDNKDLWGPLNRIQYLPPCFRCG